MRRKSFLEVGDGWSPVETGHHVADDEGSGYAHRKPLQAKDEERCWFGSVIDAIAKSHCNNS
ncbi:MAG: hypothetical protein RQM90_03500 [Methanoculleus sp.]